MKEIYVKEMPKKCEECSIYSINGKCRLLHKYTYDYTARPSCCPLKSLHEHDKEYEDKIKELQEVDNKRAFRLYAVLYDVLEKQDPENVASRIDYLTGKDYSEMCELYKTAKNLKQHDRELVKEVCEKIARNVRVRKIQEEWYVIETDLRAVLDQIQRNLDNE